MKHGEAWKSETRPLDDNARRAANGSFIQLSHGYTHYETTRTKGPRPIVLVHGFSVPYFVWDPTFRALADAGMYAIRYDLYGRGYSDRPRIAYDLALFLDQLGQLLDALGYAQADLVGMSMGGSIAAAFAVTSPQRVHKLVLIDPSGASANRFSSLYKLATLPGVANLILALAGTDRLMDSLAEYFFEPDLVRLFRERYQTQLQFHGFRNAILSTVRHNMLGSFSKTYAQLGKLSTPVLLIWGENDRIVPFQQSAILRRLLPHADFLVVPQCGHGPPIERPDVVHPRLIDFLS
jgi:pimeloyl-ACP methyl ester carboxylesterase